MGYAKQKALEEMQASFVCGHCRRAHECGHCGDPVECDGWGESECPGAGLFTVCTPCDEKLRMPAIDDLRMPETADPLAGTTKEVIEVKDGRCYGDTGFEPFEGRLKEIRVTHANDRRRVLDGPPYALAVAFESKSFHKNCDDSFTLHLGPGEVDRLIEALRRARQGEEGQE